MSGSVLVTGVSGGLGGAVAYRFAADGWRVIGLDRVSHVEPPAISGTGSFALVTADAAEPGAISGALELATAQPSQPLRAVVNLVGGIATGGRVHETPLAQFEAMLELNLRSAYVVTAAAMPHLVAAGGGSVVCVGSRASLRPFPGAAGYITAKAAVLGLVDALAVEYRDDRVRVNAVLPSIIDTPANRASQPEADHSRWVTPAQVADVIAYLCSDAAAATSGAHIPIYGRA